MRRSTLFLISAITAVTTALAADNDFGVMTYEGKSYAGCRFERITSTGVEFSSKNGSFSIPLDKAPWQVRSRFKAEYETALAQRTALQRDAAKAAAARSQGAVQLVGHVSQKFSNGVLVDCERARPVAGALGSTGGGGGVAGGEEGDAFGIFFLKDLSPTMQFVDGDAVKLFAIPAGEYQYQDTTGAVRTVRAFSCKLPEEDKSGGKSIAPNPQSAPSDAKVSSANSSAEALRLYPDLAKPGSAFNTAFLALYEETKRTNPQLLSKGDWKLTLAKQVAASLGAKATGQ